MGRFQLGATAQKAAAMVWPGFFFRRIMANQRGLEPCCVVSFDCDFPRDIAVLPALVPLLQKAGVPASFACIGQWVREFPLEHKLVADAGFELLNHTETHPNLYHPDYDYATVEGLSRQFFNRISVEQRRSEIERCHATFSEVLRVEPVGFRTPHFGALHVDDIYPILAEMGYVFSSSKLAAASGGAPFCTEEGLWEFPLSPCPEHPYGVFDSWHSISKHGASHQGKGQLGRLFGKLLDTTLAQGGLVNIYLDPKDALESGELADILATINASGVPVRSYLGLAEQLSARELSSDIIPENPTGA
jgi:peptidoglycan-N-acetylglucosamine deacetylase